VADAMTEVWEQPGGTSVDSARQLLERVLLTLVSVPDAVGIESSAVGDATTFVVRVAPVDIDRVIGEDGRTVRALRMILGAIGLRQKHRFILEIDASSE
jgi:predicted RNA-binding protein YlqC (UPF0109 family)